MFKRITGILLAVLMCVSMIIPALADETPGEKYYRIVLPMIPDDDLFNIDDDANISIGWGGTLIVALAAADEAVESAIPFINNEKETVEKDTVWEATLPDGSVTAPKSTGDEGYAWFAIPYEMTGTMTVSALVNGTVVAEFQVEVVDVDITGQKLAGWSLNDGQWFYIDEDGMLARGWKKVAGTWYYFNSDAVMQTGWQKVSGKWYYLAKGGAMQTGWKKIDGKWYYLSNSGAMQTSWKKINGTWYYFAKGGTMKQGWLKSGNTWYYLKASGAMATGTQIIDGKTYRFADNGAWIK